jgi:ribose-phosphate pyrophosphokinase
MKLVLVSGSANRALAGMIANELDTALADAYIERFPDSEIHVELRESVRGGDVYLVQPTSPRVDEHLLELLLLADACRRDGAGRVTAIVPYFGYARQDRRAHGRESVGARVVTDLLGVARIDRVVAVDLHTAALEGFFTMPVEPLTAVPLLAEALRPFADAQSVVVAPDLGAAKLADRYAKILDLPAAVIHKTRISGSTVRAHGVTGEVRDRKPLIVDDMISTAGTIVAAVDAVLAAGALPQIVVAASHGLFVGPAAERLARHAIRRVIVTDSVAAAPQPFPTEVIGLAKLLASAVDRMHADRSLADLLGQT